MTYNPYGFPVQDAVTSEVLQANFAAVALTDGTRIPQLNLGAINQITLNVTGIAAGAYDAGDNVGAGNFEVTVARGEGLGARVIRPIIEVSPALTSGVFRLEFYNATFTGQVNNSPFSLTMAADKGKCSGHIRFLAGIGVGGFTRYVADESLQLKCTASSTKYWLALIAETAFTLGSSPVINLTLPLTQG